MPAPYLSTKAFRWVNRTLSGQCRLPVDIILLMYCLADHRNVESGLSWPSQAKIAVETTMSEERVAVALRSAEQLQIITRRSVTVAGVIKWGMNVGHTPPPSQLHLRHAITAQIRQMGLTDRQQLCAEAAVRIGYDWATGEVVTTIPELAAELPHWSPMKLHEVLKELSAQGIMPVLKKGHGGRPARRSLVLDERQITSRKSESSGVSDPGSLKVPGCQTPEVLKVPGCQTPEVASRPYKKRKRRGGIEEPRARDVTRVDSHIKNEEAINGTSSRGPRENDDQSDEWRKNDEWDGYREAQSRSLAFVRGL